MEQSLQEKLACRLRLAEELTLLQEELKPWLALVDDLTSQIAVLDWHIASLREVDARRTAPKEPWKETPRRKAPSKGLPFGENALDYLFE